MHNIKIKGIIKYNPRFCYFWSMKEKIILIGKAASGKDFFQKHLVSSGWVPLRQYTTRPKRPNEDGDEYHFVSEKEFDNIYGLYNEINKLFDIVTIMNNSK